MDEILNFFTSPDAPVKKNVFAGSSRNSTVCLTNSAQKKRNDDYGNSSKYAEMHIETNNKHLLEKYKDFDSDDGEHTQKSDPVHEKYNFNHPCADFPILAHRREILQAVEENAFVVLEGPTACGKTTQVPQYILDDAYSKGKQCNIVIAQPRRIAASTNAERVATERKLPVGTLIGYQIGFDEKKHVNEDTRILFCTTGVLLAKLIRQKHFGNYTHIILDEVHERNKDMDFLFVVIRKLFTSSVTKVKVKIILMSATIQAEQFSTYFSFPKNGQLQPAPIVSIKKRSQFNIFEFFLENFYEIAPKAAQKEWNSPELNISDNLYIIATYLISHFDKFDCEDYSDDEEPSQPKMRKTVLVFLPGIHDIIRMETIMRDHWDSINKDTIMMPVILHSMSDTQQRHQIFQRTNENVRKIILATNIAESSITVPDVKYVLDFCRTKLLLTDTSTNFSSLKLSWASRSNCKQRAGRAGRLFDGRCYRFVQKSFYQNDLTEYTVPELVNSPLENVILSTKLLNMGPPASILALAMDRPKLNDITNTILILKEIGALLRTFNDEYSDMDGDISFIGKIMADLPIDVKIAKFIILGYCFSMYEECIIIGAALNSRPLFRLNSHGKVDMKLYSDQLEWAHCSGSDLITLYNAYLTWCSKHNSGYFGTATNKAERFRMKMKEYEWCEKYRLDADALNECHVQVNELKARLECSRLHTSGETNRVRWSESERAIILKVVIAGAFYPNYFARRSFGGEDYASEMFKCIGTRDPRYTVYFTGFDRKHNRYLYTKSIKDIFVKNGVVEDASNIRVSFDCGADKMFVTFKSNRHEGHGNEKELMPGTICTEVYKALKMRNLKSNSEVWVMQSPDDEKRYAELNNFVAPKVEKYYEAGKIQNEINKLCMPRILDQHMIGIITNIESCDLFWFQPEAESKRVEEFEAYLNNYRKTALKQVSPKEQLFLGTILIVEVFGCDMSRYHRAKVIVKGPLKRYQVQLIDSGRIHECQIDQLYHYCGTIKNVFDLPPRCFECRLAQLQPSQIRYPYGVWSSNAIELFKAKAINQPIEIEIYSLTNGKANVFVKCSDKEVINNVLVKKNFGEFVDEDYISKHNHLQRKNQRELQRAHSDSENFIDPMCIDHYIDENVMEVESPPRSMCTKRIKLSGPFSPLTSEPYGLSETVKYGTTSIDRYSVNSILLNNDPHDLTQKYLVAATICLTNENRRNFNIRYNTLMPNLRGFGPLMALIFCPTMQVRTDASGSFYTGLRCGLGYDNIKKRTIFVEHDMVFNLDVEITQEDIEMVNHIRYCMDTLLLTYPGEGSTQHLRDDTKSQILMKIKELIVDLLEKKRNSITIDLTEFNWNPDFEKMPRFCKSHATDLYGNRAIYPFHHTLATKSNYDTNKNLRQLYCKQLHDLAEIAISFSRTIVCKLCDKELETVAQLKMHLISGEHIDNEARIGFKS